VRDEEQRHLPLAGDGAQQTEHLRLHGHLERGQRHGAQGRRRPPAEDLIDDPIAAEVHRRRPYADGGVVEPLHEQRLIIGRDHPDPVRVGLAQRHVVAVIVGAFAIPGQRLAERVGADLGLFHRTAVRRSHRALQRHALSQHHVHTRCVR